MRLSPNLTNLLERASLMQSEGRSIDDVLAFFRAEGCSKIESINLLMKLERLTLRDAKDRVHWSKAWEDVRDADEAFHATITDGVALVGDANAPGEGR